MTVTLEEALMQLVGPGGPFPVEEESINGVSYRVIRNGPATLAQYYDLSLVNADKTFLVYQGERWTFAQTHAEMQRLASALTGTLQIKKGDRVVIAMRNYPEWVTAFMAITAVGAVAVPLNGWWTEEEFDYALEDCGAVAAFVDHQRLERLKRPAQRLGFTMIAVRCEGLLPERTYSYQSLLDGASADAGPAWEVAPDDDATIFYTSGSTGHPKGVVSTHRAILSVMMMWGVATRARMTATGIDPETLPYQASSLVTVPLFHVTGSHAIFLLSFLIGRKLVLMYKWDPEDALKLIEAERITGFTGVPTMSWELLNSPEAENYDLSSLTDIGSGGAARPADHVRQLRERFPGAMPSSGYGLTETNAAGATNWGDDYLTRPGSTGRPTPPLIEMKIVDEDGQDVPIGQDGEVAIKSAANARGYWNRPDATAAAFRNGWFLTGDIGRFDADGFLYIVDRAKDIVIRGGENISCLEVEEALYRHPDVFEAAVFGLPDERLGEIVAAVVVPKPGRGLDVAELQVELAKHIAPFKIPEKVWVQTEQLPRTASGKIFKRGLREDRLEG